MSGLVSARARAIRTLIVDDERVARASVRVLLRKDADIEIVGECSTGAESVRAIRDLRPDLVFLDIQMPQMNGLDVLRAVEHDHPFAVIFVTAFDTYALEAFAVRALDYVLKPFDDERFARALERAKDQIRRGRMADLAEQMVSLARARPAPAGAAPRAYEDGSSERIVIRNAGRVCFVSVSEIDWIEADDYCVQLHVGAKSHIVRESMRELETRLDPRQFARIHRSTIVRIDRIKELRPILHGEYAVRLRDGTELKLSRGRRDSLRALLSPR